MKLKNTISLLAILPLSFGQVVEIPEQPIGDLKAYVVTYGEEFGEETQFQCISGQYSSTEESGYVIQYPYYENAQFKVVIKENQGIPSSPDCADGYFQFFEGSGFKNHLYSGCGEGIEDKLQYLSASVVSVHVVTTDNYEPPQVCLQKYDATSESPTIKEVTLIEQQSLTFIGYNDTNEVRLIGNNSVAEKCLERQSFRLNSESERDKFFIIRVDETLENEYMLKYLDFAEDEGVCKSYLQVFNGEIATGEHLVSMCGNSGSYRGDIRGDSISFHVHLQDPMPRFWGYRFCVKSTKLPDTKSPTTSPTTTAPTKSPLPEGSPTTSPTTTAPTKSPLPEGSPTTSPTTIAPTKSPLPEGSPTTSPTTTSPTKSPTDEDSAATMSTVTFGMLGIVIVNMRL